MSEQITSAALSYRANAPLVDSMLQELGIVNKESGTLNDLLTGHNSLASSIKTDDYSVSNSVEVNTTSNEK
jgi:flotillin